MVGWFSSATDETVLFDFHSHKSLYIYTSFKLLELGVLYAIYGTWCVGLVVLLVNNLSLSTLDQVNPPLMYSLLDQVPFGIPSGLLSS